MLYETHHFSLSMLCGQMNAQKQKGQAVNAASAQKAINILKVLFDDFEVCAWLDCFKL